MPTFSMSELPPPRSWDEFEEIACDLLSREWNDPNAARHGRQGQAQKGVDIYGRRQGQGSYIGAQCKLHAGGNRLTYQEVQDEVQKAEGFEPPLAELIMLTTSPRDAHLQREVRHLVLGREQSGKFSVHVWSWEDICSRLAGHPDLVEKHYPQYFTPGATATVQVDHRLPIPVSSFVGRNPLIETGLQYLNQGNVRLLTLAGPGGAGKTRLALEIGRSIEAGFSDGAVFVDLSAVVDSALVPTAILQALNVSEDGSRSAADQLASYLADKNLLLELDNFEHVLHAAPIATDLLRNAPKLKILVASRKPLRVEGEQQLRVDPMELPDLSALPSSDELAQNEAVALFVQRVQAINPAFILNDQNASTVAEICVWLDGLPLAIELAAARARLFSDPSTLLEHLKPRLPALIGGRRDVPPRQRTMKDAIGWSYDLLAEEEQSLFRTLAVFVGGGTIEEIESVATSSESFAQEAMIGLEALVEASLLRVDTGKSGGLRFSMLATVREYASELLESSDKADQVRHAYMDALMSLLRTAEPNMKGPEPARWLDRIEEEHDNYRSALAWVVEHGSPEEMLLFAGGLHEFWSVRGYWSEAHVWLERVIEKTDGMRSELRASILQRGAHVATELGIYHRVTGYLKEAIAIHTENGNPEGESVSLDSLSEIYLRQNAPDKALVALERSLEIEKSLGDKRGQAARLNNISRLYSRLGETQAAHQYQCRALELIREVGDHTQLALALGNVGLSYSKLGQYKTAAELFDEGMKISLQINHKKSIAFIHGHRASLEFSLDHLDDAWSHYNDALEMFRDLGAAHDVARMLLNSSTVAKALGNVQEAQDRIEEARGIYHELGNWEAEAHTLVAAGNLALDTGKPKEACQNYRRALGVYRELGYSVGVIDCVRNIAEAIRMILPEQAARLFGAAEAARGKSEFFAIDTVNADRIKEDWILISDQLSESVGKEQWDIGRAMSLDEAVTEISSLDCERM